MLGVPLPEVDALPLLGEELSLAAVNRPNRLHLIAFRTCLRAKGNG